MEGAMKPPATVVVPKVVIWPRSLLTAGQNGRCGLVHGGVCFRFHDTKPPGKQDARPDDIKAGGWQFYWDVFSKSCLALFDASGDKP
jgi:hypothetical protein